MNAFAMVAERVRIGAMIQPLARRRPWKVARQMVTLDHVSNGRFVLCVGLGPLDDAGFGNVGEPTDRRVHTERLDEALEILAGLWIGGGWPLGGRRRQWIEADWEADLTRMRRRIEAGPPRRA